MMPRFIINSSLLLCKFSAQGQVQGTVPTLLPTVTLCRLVKTLICTTVVTCSKHPIWCFSSLSPTLRSRISFSSDSSLDDILLCCKLQMLHSLQEKMECRLDERMRDMHEMLECCQTKVSDN